MSRMRVNLFSSPKYRPVTSLVLTELSSSFFEFILLQDFILMVAKHYSSNVF